LEIDAPDVIEPRHEEKLAKREKKELNLRKNLSVMGREQREKGGQGGNRLRVSSLRSDREGERKEAGSRT